MSRIGGSEDRTSPQDGERPDSPPLPVNLEAEQALLGAIFVNNRAYERVAGFLRPEHFGNGAHGRIYAASAKLIDGGVQANPVTLKLEFDRDEGLKEAGGSRYLATLATSAITVLNAESYGRAIFDCHLRRELISAGMQLVSDAYQAKTDVPAAMLLEQHESRLFSLGDDQQDDRGGFKLIGDGATEGLQRTEAAYKAGGKMLGLPTGLDDLDRAIGGLEPGDLILIGGRPGMGKTLLASHIADHAGVPVAFFELEQSRVQLAQRAMAGRSGVSTKRQRMGDLDLIHWQELVQAAGHLQTIPVWIDDTPGLSISQIRQRLRQAKRRLRIGLGIVDHLHLVRVSERMDRRLEIDHITSSLKVLGKELGMPILLLAQLSRKVEEREDKRPQLSDLRDSGGIEQDCDIVLFVYRDEYYLARSKPVRRDSEDDGKFNDRVEVWERRSEQAKGIAEIIISKQREGPPGVVKTYFDGEKMRFSNLIREENSRW